MGTQWPAFTRRARPGCDHSFGRATVLHPLDDGIEHVEAIERSLAAAAVAHSGHEEQPAPLREWAFRVVSAEELFRDILLRQQQERIRYRKLVEAADKIRDQLASAPNIDAYTLAARSHRNIQRESIRIARSLSDSVTEMRLNALGGPEAYELMEKSIVEPLKKLDADYMNAQRDALDALVGGDSAALAATLTRQDNINGKMKEILKQMSQWDSFVDVLNQLNEIIKLQTGVKDSTEKLKKQEDDALFKP